jgi:O-antigen ligase
MINVVAVPHGFVGSSVEILNYAYGFLLMATIVHLVDRWETLLNCLWAWLAAAFVVSAIGVLAVFGAAPDWAYDDFTLRVSSTLKFENQIPSFLLPILPAAVVLAVSRPQRLRRRLFLIAVALSGIGTIAMTGSRAGLLMVALFLAGVLWIAASEGNRPRIHATLITATFAILAAMQIGISSYALATYEGEYALGETPPWQRPTVTLYEWATNRGGDLSTIDGTRVVQTSFVFSQIADHAVFGIGPKMVGPRFRMEEIHNTYLGVLIEFGLFGTALFLGMIGLVLHTGWRAMSRYQGDLERAIIRALLVGLALLLFYQFTMFGLRQRNIWILMGLIVALPRVLQASGLWRKSPVTAP